jgi:hypothetical protein
MKTVQYLKLDERVYTAVTCLTCIYYSHGQAQAEQGWLIEKYGNKKFCQQFLTVKELLEGNTKVFVQNTVLRLL